MNNKYKLVGIFNEFDVVPSSVRAIFLGEDNKYYIGVCDNDFDDSCEYFYTRFMPYANEYKDYIKFINNCKSTLEVNEEYYRVGDLALCSFQISDNEIYIGTIDKYVEFIKSYKAQMLNSDYEFKNLLANEIDYEIGYLEPLVNQAREQGAIERNK